ncbi:MAG: DUF3822 family protein [Prolixibacteraceae bacterium]|jgi:hypothetical protein|nr:DUF3822 family protein [Prolixibacteraceae bacterium]
MHEISYVDETFDLNFILEYHLSIQIGLDGFSFCILDTIQKKYVLLQHFPLAVKKSQFLTGKIREIYDREEVLNKQFKSVAIGYNDLKATIIPSSFSTGGELQQIISLNQPTERNEEIAACHVKSFSHDIVFSYPQELRAFLDSKYPEYHFFHSAYPLLNAVMQQKGKAAKTAVLYFNKKYFHIILLEKSIRLFNSFFYKTENDFLYHTLHICKNLSFDAEKDEVLVGGMVAGDSDYIRQLKKYLLHVRMLKPDQDFHYSYTFEKTPGHYFAGLFNSYKCVL